MKICVVLARGLEVGQKLTPLARFGVRDLYRCEGFRVFRKSTCTKYFLTINFYDTPFTSKGAGSRGKEMKMGKVPLAIGGRRSLLINVFTGTLNAATFLHFWWVCFSLVVPIKGNLDAAVCS